MRLLPVIALSLGLAVPALAQVPAVCLPTTTLSTAVQLTWEPAVQPAGVVLKQYLVDQRVDGGPFSQLAAYPASALEAVVSGLLVGHLYEWRLKALGALGTIQGASVDASWSLTAPPCVAVFVVGAPKNFSAKPQ